MVSADGKDSSFAASFVGRAPRSPAQASGAAPEAANAVNQLADSFREMLMRAVETDPSQLQALTSLVSRMGVEAGGPSQGEIDKMAKSLSGLSVGRNPQGVHLWAFIQPCSRTHIF